MRRKNFNCSRPARLALSLAIGLSLGLAGALAASRVVVGPPEKDDLKLDFIKLTESLCDHGLPGELAGTSASPAPRAGFTVSPKPSPVSGGPQALFDQGAPCFPCYPGRNGTCVSWYVRTLHAPASSSYSAGVAYLRIG
jgi:hypothetical protein